MIKPLSKILIILSIISSTITANFYAPINSTLDTRLLTKEGREQVKQDYEAMNKNMYDISQTLPDKNSDNIVESTFGYILDTLNLVTLGIFPTYNNGGLLAQIPVLTGTRNVADKTILLVSDTSDKYILAKDDFMNLKDSEYYKSLNDKDKIKFKDMNNLYVSKNPITITKDNATYQNFINGIMNNAAEALKNGLEQTGQFNTKKPVELILAYNSTHGFLPDLLEAGVDKFIGTTGSAKTTGEFIYNATTVRGVMGFNLASHSKGNALVKSGLNWKLNNGGFKDKEYFYTGEVNEKGEKEYKLPTIVSFGSPINKKDMEELIGEKGLGYKYSGSYTKKGDFVGEGVGGNKGINDSSNILDRLNMFNIYKLFTDDSPHSSYICQDYERYGVKCGYK